MHQSSLSKMKTFVERYLADVRQSGLQMVDIGSRSILGHPTYRSLFDSPQWSFRGLDIEERPNAQSPPSRRTQIRYALCRSLRCARRRGHWLNLKSTEWFEENLGRLARVQANA